MSARGSTVPRKVKGAESSRFGADYVLLDPAGKMLRGLNPTAARVWELIDGARSASQIAAQLASEFGAEPERSLADVLAFLDLIALKQLIEGVEESP